MINIQWNADFDGDILNIIGMVDESIAHLFRKFDPINCMEVDRDSGKLNSYFSITKGQLIDLYFFCTMGKMENDTEELFPVESKGEIIYVPASKVNRYKSGELPVDECIDYMINGIQQDFE